MSKSTPPSLGFLKPHSFKPVPDHRLTTPLKIIWRCDVCDSEILFDRKKLAGQSIHDVNQQIALHYTKFACLEQKFFHKS